jgi:predicted DNA-binding transcriptional regulator YafY
MADRVARHGPASVDTRLRRLVDVFAWLVDNGGFATFEELAERFGGNAAQIQRDLIVAMCSEFRGAFPGDLIDVDVDEDGVTLREPKLDVVARSLSRSAAYRLLVAARLVGQTHPHLVTETLASAIQRLSQRLSENTDASLQVAIETPAALNTVQAAIADHRPFTILYRRPYDAQPSTYLIVGLRTYLDEGVWYLEAQRAQDGARRTFRLDRVVAVETSTVPVIASREAETARSSTEASQASGTRTVRLAVTAGNEWIVAHYRGRIQRTSQVGQATRVTAVLELFEPVVPRLVDIAVRLGSDFAILDDASLSREVAEALADAVYALDRLAN